jgi:hypothetical protein
MFGLIYAPPATHVRRETRKSGVWSHQTVLIVSIGTYLVSRQAKTILTVLLPSHCQSITSVTRRRHGQFEVAIEVHTLVFVSPALFSCCFDTPT